MGMGMMGPMPAEYREGDLIMVIQETVEPDSWYDAGGEGTVTAYEGKKLIIYQTPEIHDQIDRFLKEMRKSLGHQVSIEARFLVVTENFLEDIGVDVEFALNMGDKFKTMEVGQSHYEGVSPAETKVPGSLAGALGGLNLGKFTRDANNVVTGYGPMRISLGHLAEFEIDFMLRAVQAHKDAKTLTAPKLTVLSGESATFSIQTDTVIALPPQVTSEIIAPAAGAPATTGAVIPNFVTIPTGTTLNITPIISPDKKHVLLNITTMMSDLLPSKTYHIETPMPGQALPVAYDQVLPVTEYSQVQTRVSVPDGGALLLGGQKITADVEMEAGVPGLSKLPILGRLFRNRSTVKDQKILLILVRPTIILQEEADAKAIGAFEGDF
jgi:type II secretory pathway component GspD/PulD (secretin)